MKVRFDPVSTLAAVFTLGSQIILCLQYALEWSGTATGLIGGAWGATIGLVGTPFAKAKVTSNRAVEQRAQDMAHDKLVVLGEAAQLLGEQQPEGVRPPPPG